MNGYEFEEGVCLGIPVLPYFMSAGQFAPSMHKPAPETHTQAHRDWNFGQFGVDQFPHSTEIIGNAKLPSDSYIPRRELSPIRSDDHQKIWEVRVRRFCCEGCVIKVKRRLRNVPGVSSAHCNVEDKTVTIVGSADPEIIFNTLESIKYLDPELLSEITPA